MFHDRQFINRLTESITRMGVGGGKDDPIHLAPPSSSRWPVGWALARLFLLPPLSLHLLLGLPWCPWKPA